MDARGHDEPGFPRRCWLDVEPFEGNYFSRSCQPRERRRLDYWWRNCTHERGAIESSLPLLIDLSLVLALDTDTIHT